MKRWQRISLVALGLAVLLAGLWLLDEPLDEQAQAWLQGPPATAQSLAYYQLLGLDAASGADPQQVGRARLQAHRQWRAEHSFSEPHVAAPAAQPLVLPDDLCRLGDAGCLQQLRSDRAALSALLAQHAELLQRYQHLLAQDDYRTLSQPSMDEPLANFIALERAGRLRALQALVLAEEGRSADALLLLQRDVQQLRGWLARADNLILKMLLVQVLAGSLDAMAVLHGAGLLPQPAPQPLLDAAERSLQAPMQREFALVGNGLLGLLDDPQTAAEMGVLRWQTRWLYKPQMTVNDSLPGYSQTAAASRLDTGEVAAALHATASHEPGLWRRLRNPLGTILSQIAGPDYNRYLARLHNLNAKLVLFNELGQPAPLAANPYWPEQRAGWDEQRQGYCFSGPREDDRALRCLPWTPPAAL